MELYENTKNSFINYLKQHGYPDESISLEWGNKNCAVDIAILADDLVTPIAIYEIKGMKNPHTIRSGINQLKRVVQLLDLSVPCYLVFQAKREIGFEVIDVSDVVFNDSEMDFEDIMESQKPTKPMTYKNAQVGAENKAIMKAARKRQKKIDRLKPLCWIVLPIIAFIVLLLDAFDKYLITYPRLCVYGVLVIIILLPFFSEISLKDFSFKRNR